MVRGGARRVCWALLLLALALALPAVALAAFPGSDPDESVRANTPNDPGFDPCESDNAGGSTCGNVFDEQYERFGFAPSSTQFSATYKNPSAVARQMQQNTRAGRNPLGQIPGVSADRAWKRSVGDPRVQVAILDTGIRWENEGLRLRVHLNAAELPKPQGCAKYDCNGDGAFNVDDYKSDPRVKITAGDDVADKLLDASDLIATFSDRTDADHNGYVDDIAGWDFFNNDNDPFDQSSYSSANNHGSGRSEDAAEEGDDGKGSIGVCPRCQIEPMRVWDTFVVDMNNFGEAVTYAADNHIEVVEGAVGGLFNSRFAQSAFRYAYRKGVLLAIVSSDLNTADHNIPTVYDEAMQVQGTVADVQGLGGDPPEVGGFLGRVGIPTTAPLGTWFRNSGTTQYGGHAHIVMPAVTGSQATGQASGAAGLLASYGLQRGITLAPNEIKQLLTLTAQDVVAENTLGTGVPDPAHPGWDQHFGYGLPDLGLALERISQGKIPPQALIDSPRWFSPLNVARQHAVKVGARLSSRTGGYTWKLEWAPGIEPAANEFRAAASGTGSGPRDSTLATLDLNAVRAALDARPGGGATNDPTAPGKGPGDRDPNEPAFTVRVQVTDADGNVGEDRKVLFAYRDSTLHPGFARHPGVGGEESQRLWDLNGDNKLDIVEARSSGEIAVLRSDGSPLPAFNGGKPVRTRRYSNVHPGAPGPKTGGTGLPLEVPRTPAIGDIDGDKEPEIVDTAGEHVYAWHADGRPVKGFPVRVNPAFSRPADEAKTNHVKRGFIGSAALGDLNGDGKLDIVAAALDQHLYGWTGRGRALPGYPMKLKDPGEKLGGAESINTPAVGDIDGDGKADVVVSTAELDGATPPGSDDVAGSIRSGVITILANAIGKSGRVYAVDGSGHIKKGWPIKPNGAAPDALPLVGPGVDQVLGDVDGDGKLDAIANVATGDVAAYGGDGTRKVTYDSTPATGNTVDKGRVLNLFENPIVANLDGKPGLEVIKGGLTLNQLVNLAIATGQNLTYNHVLQAWAGSSGNELPAFPKAVEDYQLLSSPMVADVADSPGVEALVGTGLYYLRSFNSDGTEAAGWPKFTGGWLFATPAVGDTDGDGKLEVTATTREGWSFEWDTDRPACGGNDEWWTSRHDERNSGAYGTDSRPPGTPRSFSVKRSSGHARLAWVAPGDDWLCGRAKSYRVLSSSRPIVHPAGAHRVGDFAAGPLGGHVTRTVPTSAKARHFAVLYRDDAGNWGHVAPLVSAAAARPRLHLTVSPRRVTAGRRVCFHMRVMSAGHAVGGATVRLGGHSTRSGARGRARICTGLAAGPARVTASRSGYRSASTTVRAMARQTRFTG
jgi:hypothetical protein